MTRLRDLLLASAAFGLVQAGASPALAHSRVDADGGYHSPDVCFANYEAPLLQGTVGTAYKTAGALFISATLRRVQVYEVEFGQTGGLSSTDCQCQWDLSLFSSTNLITATTVTPNKLDPADGACVAIFQNNASTELTYTTAGNGLSLKNWGINQRGSYRWRALDDGDNIVIPSVQNTGIGVRTLSSNFNGSAVGNLSFVER